MTNLLLGLLLFIGIHSISIMAEPLRNRFAAKSELGWKAVYALISFVGLFFLIKGYSEARLSSSLIYISPDWFRHLTSLLMLPVFILFLAPYFPGKINTVTRYPQLIAITLWAVSHLLVNGNIADLILFGSFLAWAITDIISMKRRVSNPVPLVINSTINDVIIVIIGLVLYGTFVFFLHQLFIGVSPGIAIGV